MSSNMPGSTWLWRSWKKTSAAPWRSPSPPGGQAQFSAALASQTADDKFGALHDGINEHLASDLSHSVLADQAG